MHGLSQILSLKLRLARNRFLLLCSHRRIQLGSYLAIVGVFFAGGYVLFYRVFAYLGSVPEIGPALSGRIMEMAFLTFFAMLLLSGIVSALSTLFRAPEVGFLFARPVTHLEVFVSRYLESFLYSSWATALLGVPLIVGFGAANHAPGMFYVSSLWLFLLYLLIPSTFGVLVLLGLARIFPQLKPRDVLVSVTLVFALALILFFRYGSPQGIMISDTEDLSRIEAYVQHLGITTSPFLPSTWLSDGLRNAERGSLPESVFDLLLLLSTALVLSYGLLILASRYYHLTWLRSQDAGSSRPAPLRRSRQTVSLRSVLTPILGQDLSALVAKDISLFFRDPVQWSQAAILAALLGIYLGSLRTSPLYHIEAPFWKLLVSFANFAFTGYILATLSIRFSYPALSLEGRAFWLLRSSPLSARRILAAKLGEAFLVTLLGGETLVLVSGAFLRVEPSLLLAAGLLLVPFCASLSSLATGLGALFVDLRERNPGKIASNAGAILTALLGLLYVAAIVSLAAWPSYLMLQHELFRAPFPWVVLPAAGSLIIVLSLTTTLTPFLLGVRSLERRDF